MTTSNPPLEPAMNRRHLAVAAVFVAILAILAYVVAASGSFVLDDETYVVKNSAVIGDASPFTSPTPPNRPELGLFRPLTVWTYRAQYESTGLDAPAFRKVNIASHALAAALLVFVAARLGASTPVAATAGAIFAVHPIHVEAVAWIVGRAEILATIFALLALLARPPAAGRTGLRLVAMAAAYAAASLAKESALPLPLALLAIDVFERLPVRAIAARFATLAFTTIALILVRVAVLGRFSPDVSNDPVLGGLPFLSRVELGVRVLGRTVSNFFLPTSLSIYYEPRSFGGAVLLLLGIALLLCAVMILGKRRSTLVRGSAILFFAGMIPFLHLVPIGWIFGDRFLYLPSAGLCVLIATGLAPRTLLRTSVVVVLLIALFGLTLARTPVFHDDLALWRDAAEKDETSGFAQFQVAGLLKAEGKLEYVSDDQRGAVHHWKRSLEVDPEHLFALEAHLELGEYAAARLGDALEAAKHYRAAASLDPSGRNPHCIDALIDLLGLYRPDAKGPPSVVTRDEARAVLKRAAAGRTDARQRAILLGLLPQFESTGLITPAEVQTIRDSLERR